LKRFHPDTRFLDLSKRRELDAIFAALEKANLVVVDCRAASTDLFIDFFAEIDLPAVLSALGRKAHARHAGEPRIGQRGSSPTADRPVQRQCGYVVVRNAAHSDSFAMFESVRSPGATQRQTRRTGNHHDPDCRTGWLRRSTRENLTITAAAKHPSFSLLDRQRLQTWQRKLYAEIESAANLLLPSK
jgi:hypothetical protein